MRPGKNMKRATMEPADHSPSIGVEDADLDQAVKILSASKFRNPGQACISPTRLLVQEPLYEKFVDKFTAAAKSVKVGDGLDCATRMRPMANSRRIAAIERFIADATQKRPKVQTGGK